MIIFRNRLIRVYKVNKAMSHAVHSRFPICVYPGV